MRAARAARGQRFFTRWAFLVFAAQAGGDEEDGEEKEEEGQRERYKAVRPQRAAACRNARSKIITISAVFDIPVFRSGTSLPTVTRRLFSRSSGTALFHT